MGPRARFDAIVFDCDGVLVDSEGLACEVWSEMAAEFGVALDTRAALRRFRGKQLSECAAWLEGEAGRALPTEFEVEFRARSKQRFERELKPIAGVADVLRRLNVPLAVASNGPRAKIEANLELTGLRAFFGERIFSAYDLNLWKPEPGFYLEVAAGLGVAPARCAVIEDSLPGVRAAVGAGMMTFAYIEHDHEEDERECAAAGVRVFRRMSDLVELLGVESEAPVDAPAPALAPG